MNKVLNDRTPGWIAKAILIAITAAWSYWSFGEMYHEGWWGAFYHKLVYLIPAAGFMLLTLIGICWPKVGGWLIIVIGGAFTVFFMDIRFVDRRLTMDNDLVGFLISGPLVLLGVLLLVEARSRKKRLAAGWKPHPLWWRRNGWYIAALAPALLIALVMSAINLPQVLTRMDDGNRGMRTIAGNGSTLVWAPEGPGWNWKQDYGGYPSWNLIALYGVAPVGMGDKPGFDTSAGQYATVAEMSEYNLCLYLSEDGLTLMDEPQNIWRIPTVSEYASALARHNVNAGCAWDGTGIGQMDCVIQPDKETPLWAPDLEPIYYWAAEEYDERLAYFVSYNGWVNVTLKSGGNPRHSYRCVRDAGEAD
jgi:hypothetical protein